MSDPLAPLRLFADMRQARLKLIGLDTPDPNARARLIRDPGVYKALIDLLFAAEKLVSAPDEHSLFWHPAREPMSEAEAAFADLLEQIKDRAIEACPVCGGDCAGANPPVMSCPIKDRAA
jgi:hypothetical protein